MLLREFVRDRFGNSLCFGPGHRGGETRSKVQIELPIFRGYRRY